MRRLLVLLLVLAGSTVALRGDIPCDVLTYQPVCYVALSPGPTQNTLQAVRVDGERTYSSTGELLLTTVSVDATLDPVEWLHTAVSDRVAGVPREQIFPAGQDREEVQRRNRVQMQASQTDAAVAALRHLGYQVDTAGDGAQILEVVADTPADGSLEPGDVVVAVAGRSVATAEEAVDALRSHRVGQEITITVRRAGSPVRVTLTLGESPQHPGRPLVGVVLRTHVDLPVPVRVDAGSIGGPSAGLMFALAVVDLLTAEDLTGGAVVAGTGSIDREGVVGPVGGIQQKVLGALHRGEGRRPATVFLVPHRPGASNLDQARATRVGRRILLVPVGSLEEALAALKTLRRGGQPTGAYALGPTR